MLLDVSTSSSNLLNGNAAGDDATNKAPVFVTEQSIFGFAAMTLLVQLVWKVLQKAGGGWADSFWLTLGIAAVVGFAQFVPILGERQWRQDWPKVTQAAIFAGMNVCVLWAAAVGIDENL